MAIYYISIYKNYIIFPPMANRHMRRIAVTSSVNILIWRVAIEEYSPMATFVNSVEHLFPSEELAFSSSEPTFQ